MSEKQLNPTSAASSLSRRHWLKGAASLAGLGVLPAQAQQSSDTQVTDAPHTLIAQERVSCWGEHQAGIVTPRPAAGMVASFDVLATDRKELERLFRGLSDRVAFLTQGGEVPKLDPRLPPVDSGIMGPYVEPDALTITVSVGASLFDDRFGLENRKPHYLKRMQAHPNDALDASLCHGDLSIQFCSNTPDTNIHALRDIIKQFPDLLVLLWKQEGTVPPVPAKPGVPPESARNFLGFRDGSANPNAEDVAAMRAIVWVGPDDEGEPDWTYGGSYQVVRIIRNFIERWDRTPLQEQQLIFGRQRDTGAPLDGGRTEHDVPDFSKDPEGKKTPLDSHIRLANPRTKATQQNLMLRRPFNYSNGVTRSGQLEMGLLFICYQANLDKGFITVQKRLDGEPLEEYIKPIGGGFFFSLPGMRDEQDWLGRALLQPA